MINISDLAQFIEDKLNASTSGSFEYRINTYSQQADARHEKEAGVDKEIVWGLISAPVGSYLPQNTIKGARLGFTVSLFIPIIHKAIWQDMVHAFIYSFNGKIFYVGSDGSFDSTFATGDTTVKFSAQAEQVNVIGSMTSNELDPIKQYLPKLTTRQYINVNIPFDMKTVEGYVVGDETVISLAPYVHATPTDVSNVYTEIAKTNFSVKRTKAAITEHIDGETTAKTKIATNGVQYIVNAYYGRNTLLSAIVGDIMDGTNQNKPYWLKIVEPSGTNYKKVVITSDDYISNVDDFVILPLVFALSWE